jgi:hypothetical protein
MIFSMVDLFLSLLCSNPSPQDFTIEQRILQYFFDFLEFLKSLVDIEIK